MKRREKLLQRRRDWARVNEMFGTNVEVYSVIDEWEEKDADREGENESRE